MHKLKFISIIITISIFMTSCSIYGEYKNEEEQKNQKISAENDYDVMDQGPVKGGVLKLFSTKPDILNPILTNNLYVHSFLGLVFEGMVKLGKDQRPVSALADRWEVSPDGLVWTFHIRENAMWHNNMPVTADDVKFTLETIQNSKINNIYKKNTQNISLFTAVDKNNFKIFLRKPNSFTAETMTFPIIPRHYFMGEDVTKLDARGNTEPVGTGPYKFVKSNDPNIIKLIENNKWWGLEEKEDSNESNSPYIGEIDVRIYGSGKDEINALQINDIDVAFIQSGDFGKYSGRPDLSLRKFISKNYEFIAYNLENPILSDKLVRQAIAYAIDRSKIINDYLAGQAVVSEIPVMPNTWLYDTSIITYNSNKAKAKEMLIQGGWEEDEGGLFKTIKGVKRYLNLELMVNDYNINRSKIADEISAQLKEIGINLSIRKIKWEDEFKQIRSKRYDMVLLGYRVSSVPDISFAYSSAEASGGFNISGYKNTTVDRLLEQIGTESDENRRKLLFTQMKGIIMDDMPYLGLFFYNNAALFSKRVKGEISPSIWDRFNGISEWYIANTHKK
ncbi:MAG: peptide ABC transporter substrate-binding protein [Clostridia bacterium]|nr:peptide ABC transporter substrate-binding protein [Clostridia bacterium]